MHSQGRWRWLGYNGLKCGGGGENCTPDDLPCGQTPYCLGYAAFDSNQETHDAVFLIAIARQRSSGDHFDTSCLFLAESVALI
jgi:hypothetical protein